MWVLCEGIQQVARKRYMPLECKSVMNPIGRINILNLSRYGGLDPITFGIEMDQTVTQVHFRAGVEDALYFDVSPDKDLVPTNVLQCFQVVRD